MAGNQNEFRTRLRAKMEEMRFTAPRLAEATGINLQTLKTYVNRSAIPRPDKLARIAEALKVEPEWLLYGIESGPVVDMEVARTAAERIGEALNTSGMSRAQMLGEIVEISAGMDTDTLAGVLAMVRVYAANMARAAAAEAEKN